MNQFAICMPSFFWKPKENEITAVIQANIKPKDVQTVDVHYVFLWKIPSDLAISGFKIFGMSLVSVYLSPDLVSYGELKKRCGNKKPGKSCRAR
ncbi:hypothetical protein VIBNISFn118_420031 [Vibrio nigripulchritudo SFn118]|nr:hypothetical protein VIBNISFn118_420031 [Vibrio nigripulchritudo SFn118]